VDNITNKAVAASTTQACVYRSRRQRGGIAIVFAVLLAVWVSTIVSIAVGPHVARGWPVVLAIVVLVGGMVLFFIGRAIHAGLFVEESRIRVVNPLGTRSVPWSRIARFRLGGDGFFSPIGFVDLTDGTSIRIFGIQASDGSLGDDYQQTEELIEELNEEVSRHGVGRSRDGL
jgi:hypothetical protein